MVETYHESDETEGQTITPEWVHSVIDPMNPMTHFETARASLAAEYAATLLSGGLTPEEQTECENALRDLGAEALLIYKSTE